MPNVQRDTLSPENERRLRDLADSADLTIQRRARLILRWHAGDTQAEIAEAVGLSVSGVSHWVRQYRENGIAVFGSTADTTEEAAPVTLSAPEPVVVEEVVVEAVVVPLPEVIEAPVKPKRGRPKAVPPTISDSASDRVPEPVAVVPEVVVQPEPAPEPAPIPEPAPVVVKPKRGRPAKAAVAVETVVPEPVPVVLPPEPVPEPVAKPIPAKKKPGRPSKTATTIHAVVEAEAPVEPIVEPEPVVPPPPPEPPKPIPTVRGLIEFYGVYLKHAQHVAAQAAYLFDVTAETHRLPDGVRRVLEAAALLHNVAYTIDPETHQTVGRDLIQQTPLEGFSVDERTMIALVTAFHRGKVHPEIEPLYLELPPEMRSDTLALAALLRIADGSDRSQTQSTEVIEAHTEPGELVIKVHGDNRNNGKVSENTEADVQGLIDKADLWERLFGQRVRVQVVTDDELARNLPGSRALNTLNVPPALRDFMPDLTITLDPAVSSGWAFRQLAIHYANRLDRLIVRVSKGELNKLPALIRELERLNGALVLAQLTKYDADLSWLSNKSHAAQTAITIVDRATALANDIEDPQSAYVSAGFATWQQHAQIALAALDFERASSVLGELHHDLNLDPVDEADLAGPVGARVGLLVWQHLAELRESVERGDSVHKALTSAYRLQDSLLYFRSLLGPEAIQALDLLTPFEAYLSTIYGVQSTLIVLEHKRMPVGTPEARAVEALETIQNRTLEELADSLPALWASVNSPQFRRALALALAIA
jgi:transposase-like protein